MEETGERLLTNSISGATIEHLHRYALASEFVKGKIVLDVASGEGYGSNFLALTAKTVYGVDLSEETVEYARKKYGRKNLIFSQGDATNLPFEDGLFDVVVSFETIEHHDKHLEMVKEIKRVLKKEGVLIISSPDKLNYTDRPNHTNPFHVKELYFEEFQELLAGNFQFISFLGQKLLMSSLIINSSASTFCEYSGNFKGIEKTENLKHPVYNLAICSDHELVEGFSSCFNAAIFYDGGFKSLENLIQEKNELLNSKAYRLGNLIISPFRYFMAFFKIK